MGLNIGNISSPVDMNWPDGSNNTAGLGQFVYYSPLANISVLPKAKVTDPNQSAPYDLADLVTVEDDIIMIFGKQFMKIYCTLEEGELKSALQGLRDGKSFKQTLDLFFPGSKAEYHGLRSWIKNNSGIFLVPDMDGTKYLFGSQCYPANLVGGEWTTAKKGDERKGGTMQFDFNHPNSVLFFTGDVILPTSSGGSAGDPQDLVFC